MLMAKLLQELQLHGKVKFDLVFLVMNPGYNEDNWNIILNNAKLLGIPINGLRAISSILSLTWIRVRAISARECVAVTFTPMRRSLAATRLLLDITMMM